MLDSCLEQLTPLAAMGERIETEAESIEMLTKRILDTPSLALPLDPADHTISKRRRRTRHTPLPGHHANRAPDHSPCLGGQSIARRTSSQWDVSTSGDVVQNDHSTTSGLCCNQAGGSAGTHSRDKRAIRKTGGDQPGWQLRLTGGLARTRSLSEIAPNRKTFASSRRSDNLSSKRWIWNLISTAAATLEFKQNLAALAAFVPKPEQIHVAPGRVRDGPIISTLTQWLDTQPKGKGRGKGKNKGNRANHRVENEGLHGHGRIGRRRHGKSATQPTQTQGLRSTGELAAEVRRAASVLHAIRICHLYFVLPAVHGAPRSRARPWGPHGGAPPAFAVFSLHGGAEARRCGLPAVLSGLVRIAAQYARDTLPFTEAINCGNALADPVNGTTFSDTCGPRAFSHTLQRTLCCD